MLNPVRLIQEVISRLHSASLACGLRVRNRWTRTPVTCPNGPVVSLTTFGPRIPRVHRGIESIARGTVRPSRLVLWLDDTASLADLPRPLRRLIDRGLEVATTEDVGPHKKYHPYVQSIPDHHVALVTADDDVIYPRRWLEDLIAGHESHSTDVIAHVARRIELCENTIAPYTSWRHSAPDSASVANFAIGFGGVLYPAPLLNALRRNGEGFRAIAPRADDVWLHRTALRDGRVVRRVQTRGRFVPVFGARDGGLMAANVANGGNDVQVRAAYSPADIAILRASTERSAR